MLEESIICKFFEQYSADKRISLDDYYLLLAHIVALRSTCDVLSTGAVIVKDRKVLSTGYTGAPRCFEHCCDRGNCWKDNPEIHKCLGIHAAQNAIIFAQDDLRGATIYIAGYDREHHELVDVKPCYMCMAMIKNAGIDNIITYTGKRTVES